MPPASRPAVSTIPAWADFAGLLAARLLARTGGDPLALARALVLLPNRRAAAALTRAFLRLSDGLLLPRMIAVADLDDADAPLGEGFGDTLPPAIDAEARRFHLAGILAAAGQRPAAALRDAASLARTLDTLTIEERSADDLKRIDVGDMSAYWQQTLQHLGVISIDWPARLHAMGRIDAAARRVALVHATARKWAAEGVGGRMVVAAGIAAAPPSVAALLRAVARLDGGMVVLPGLDLGMCKDAWDSLDAADPAHAAHPQASLKALLEAMDVARGEVEEWTPAQAPTRARVEAAARALDPAAFTGRSRAGAAAALADLRLIEAANPAEEALVIAAAMRRAVAEPGRTAALVTPDRGLAARVAAALARWGIVVDDSAGQPLSQTPPGAFLRLLAAAAAERFAPVPLLALLKHPFAGSADRPAHLAHVRALDLKLRGPAPAPGLGPVGRLADPGWWAPIAAALAPLAGVNPLPLPEWISRLAAAATALAGDRAWTGADGRALGEAAERIEAAAAPLGDLPASALPLVLAALLGDVAVRPVHGIHPRLSILGLLEARLQRADLMILGGLNEGTWPAPPPPDPWLPPAARTALGLPPAERRIGLAAHDFLAALGAPQVLLTRARRDASAPTNPSRFLLRLLAMAGGEGTLASDPELLAVARRLDAPATAPLRAPRPAPRPPAALRPRQIRVTDIDLIRADPYAFYARRILRLSERDPVAGELSAAARGTFIHAVMEAWARSGEPVDALQHHAIRLFDRDFGDRPRLAALWRPRILNAMRWAAQAIAENRQDGWRTLAVEAKGSLDIAGITVIGRPDRIDAAPDGALAIIDYKTGGVPNADRIRAGFALQLPVLALMAERGAFADDGVAAASSARLEFWKLSGGRSKPGEVAGAFKDKGEFMDGATAATYAAGILADLADAYLLGHATFPAKLKPEFADIGRSFDQLARIDEWVDR